MGDFEASLYFKVQAIFVRYHKGLTERNLNLPTWLLIFYTIAVNLCIDIGFNIAFALSTRPEEGTCWAPIPEENKAAAYQISFVHNIIFFIAYPVMGWLADIKIGRQKSINLSLFFCWFGTFLQVISYCIQYGTCGLPVNVAKYGISTVALLLLVLGTAGFYSNMLAYGLDQLFDASNTQLRAFVHWLVWGLFVGLLIEYMGLYKETIYNSKLVLVTSIITCTLITIALCLNIIFKVKFESTGILSRNPYKMIYQVLKYAWQHKSPENRSALTYWENNIPSRINLGKEKYGGPFKETDVEDVKTFWRIVVVLLSTFGFYIPCYIVVDGVFPYLNAMKGAKTSLNGYGSVVLWKALDEQIIILVPLVELIILPLFPKSEYFILNPLRGLKIVYFLLLTGLIGILILDTAGHYLAQDFVYCYFTTSSSYGVLPISFLYYAIPLTLTGLADVLSYIFLLEFICCQSPLNMSGMLSGVLWFIRGFYLNIGALLALPFSLWTINGPDRLSCSFWILVFEVLLCIVGFLVFWYTSRHYKRRIRGEMYLYHEAIETHLDRVLQREENLL